MNKIILAIGFALATATAFAKSQDVEYSAGDTALLGHVSYNEALQKPAPGILIVHDWMGMTPFVKEKADLLATKGYVAFAADIYGKGVFPKDAKEAGQLAGKYKDDRNLLRARVKAAYDKLAAMPNVDKNKIVVMGYCFGGTTALELARSGAQLAGTVSFHGGLSTPTPEDAKNIKGKVLVLHGGADPFVPKEEVKAFKDEMKKAKVKMEFVSYPGAVHAFAVPSAGNDPSKGAAYDEKADKKSWAKFEKFLAKVTGKRPDRP